VSEDEFDTTEYTFHGAEIKLWANKRTDDLIAIDCRINLPASSMSFDAVIEILEQLKKEGRQ
jgi:hypothetical protein